jgi:hypothetical protein
MAARGGTSGAAKVLATLQTLVGTKRARRRPRQGQRLERHVHQQPRDDFVHVQRGGRDLVGGQHEAASPLVAVAQLARKAQPRGRAAVERAPKGSSVRCILTPQMTDWLLRTGAGSICV